MKEVLVLDTAGSAIDLTALPKRLSELIIEVRPPAKPSIPDEIFALPLKKLAIHQAGLTRVPPLNERLEILDLDDNALTELPDELCRLPKLKRLSVARNRLVKLPDAIGALAKLVALDARDNQLTQVPRSLDERRPLRELRLEGNPIPPRLSPLVVRQIERLGGKMVPSGKTLPGVPEPLRQFVQDVVWPQGKIFEYDWHTIKSALNFTWQEIEGGLSLFTDNNYELYFVPLEAAAERPYVYRVSHAGGERLGLGWLDELLKKVKRKSPPRATKNRDAEGLTPLMRECDYKDVDAARALVAAGADLNEKLTRPYIASVELPKGSTALHLSIGSDPKQEQLVRLLVEAGADVNACGPAGYTPLHYASRLERERIEGIIRLLVSHGASLNARTWNRRSRGETPLYSTIGTTMLLGTMQLLLELGADPNVADDDGVTPLHLAAYLGDRQFIEALLASGARADATVPADTPMVLRGETPQQVAQRRGQLEVVALLSQPLSKQ